MQKRVRIFAGPNGSGKSTIIEKVVAELEEKRLGVIVNADEIEKTLKQKGQLRFSDFQLSIEKEKVLSFFQKSKFSPVYRNEPDLWKQMDLQENVLSFRGTVDSYLAADLADLIRNSLLDASISFSFETVMSHPGKLDFLSLAKKRGYKVYLYYIATEDPNININRVRLRVLQHGHPVAPEVIEKRYYKSLENLKSAVKLSDRSFIFDNTYSVAQLIAKVEGGVRVSIIDPNNVPYWFDYYLIGSDR